MNFDEMVELISNMKNIKGEECLICHLPIDENVPNNIIKLSCKHYYHKLCVENLTKLNAITCPYCQKTTNTNKIKPTTNLIKKQQKIIPTTSIAKTTTSVASTSVASTSVASTSVASTSVASTSVASTSVAPCILKSKNVCTILIKTGKNKGYPCNKFNCKKHIETVIKQLNTCSFILKTGKNKGNACNRNNCMIHNKTIIL